MEDPSQPTDAQASAEPAISLPDAEGESGAPPGRQLLERLRTHVPADSRYTLQAEIARGGMGAIWRIWDEDLRRNLAMKVILGKAEASSGGDSPPVDSRLLGRFLEEAQVTGQLDHPGIVPVHELGLDSTGRVYFTMKLVKGRDLKQVFDLVFGEREGWNETRALGVLLKVCESVAYAHTKGVVHRDLKPANVMVGSFGEVYVMDWGLARVLGRRDAHDLRLAPEHVTASIRTERRQERDDTPDAPLLTLDGDVVGTPSYMPPEQARGEIEKLSARSDVYSLGAILYHLLTRQAPYCPPGAKVSNHAVLGMVLHGSPPPIEEIRRDAPPELVAISEKAMARDANARYASTLELAEDLQAYLEGRVVRAHQTGAWVEAKKWVKRNKPLAASLAAAVALLVAGLVTSLAFKSRADQKAADLTAANTTIGQRNLELEESTRAARRNLYVSTLSGAQSARRLNEYGTVRRLLASAPEEMRGFEWGYLNAAVDTSLLALEGDYAAISPDGRLIAIASEEQHDARIYVLSTGRELVRLEGHTGAVYSVEFSPDGTRVLTGSEDKTARVFDVATGKELMRLAGHGGPVAGAVFTHDGTRIGTASWNEFLRVWDARTGREISRIPSRSGFVSPDSFSADGARLLVTTGEDFASVMDTATGKELLRLVGHQGRVWYAAFSPDGTRISTASDDKSARIWEAATGQEIARLEAWAGSGVAAFSPDSARVLTVTDRGQANVSDAATGKQTMSLLVGTRSVNSAAFSRDGSRIVTTMGDNTASLWDAATGIEIARYEGLSRLGRGVFFSADGSRFVTTARDDRVVRVWDATADGSASKLAGHGSLLWFAAFSPDGAHVATASWDKTAGLWDVATGKELARLVGHAGNVGHASFSREGARLVTSSADGTTRIWDTATSRELARFEIESHRYHSAALSPDGKRILAWSEQEPTPSMWDATTGETLVRFVGHTGTVWAADFDADGTRVVTGGGVTARVWDAGTGQELARLEGHTRGVMGVTFSPDGKRVATASDDHSARVWDAATGQELARMEGHPQTVRSVAFSPDGTRIVTGSEDRTARVWDAATGQELVRLEGHTGGVSAAAFSPDGTRIVTASWDKTARVWDSVPYRVRYAERRSVEMARPAAERIVKDVLAGPGSLIEAESRIEKDLGLDATTRRVALDVLLERCSRAHAQAQALESKRAERTWIARMLGLEPWPSESDAETALRAKGQSLVDAGSAERSGWRKLVVDAPPDDEVQTLLLARRNVASAEEEERGEFRSRFARALFRLGRFDEALTEQREAIAETQVESRSSLKQDLVKLEADIAAWRDESGQLRRAEWTERSATLAREIAELERDAEVRLWLDKAR